MQHIHAFLYHATCAVTGNWTGGNSKK